MKLCVIKKWPATPPASNPRNDMSPTPTTSPPAASRGEAAANAATPVISISPVVLAVPGRVAALQLRISAPVTGQALPILLLSHGHGRSNNLSSLNGNAPLADYWAAHGFVVIQPTHLDSKTLDLGPETPGWPLFWRSRVEDMTHIIDQLAHLESSVPLLSGRLDHTRIAVAGISLGGHTAGMLLGAQLTDPGTGEVVTLAEPRIKAGILLSAPGAGGADLSEFAAQNFSFFRQPSFAEMTTPTLIVMGDQDVSAHLTTRGADWHADPYNLSPGPKCLLTVVGGEHLLGGVTGYDAAETTDENLKRVALVQHLTWAYLRTTLYPEDSAWPEARTALQESPSEQGRVECK